MKYLNKKSSELTKRRLKIRTLVCVKCNSIAYVDPILSCFICLKCKAELEVTLHFWNSPLEKDQLRHLCIHKKT